MTTAVTDETYALIEGLHADDPLVVVVQLRRNFGQTAAFAAGFDKARGQIIVTSDGDLQNDPGDIAPLLARLDEGYDIVCGWRQDRKDPWLTKVLPSKIANWLISVTTGVHLHDYGCSLKVFRSEVVKPLRLYGELHRFIPAIASEQGVDVAELVVNHRPRQHGLSKYGLSRTVRVVFDLVTVKFPPELLDASAADVWAGGFDPWLGGECRRGVSRLHPAVRGTVDR